MTYEQKNMLEENLENLRKKYTLMLKVTLLPFPLFIIVCIVTMIPEYEINFPGKSMAIIILFLLTFVMILIGIKHLKKDGDSFINAYKSAVVSNVLQEEFQDFSYQPDQCLPMENIQLLCSYKNFCYKGEDLISGIYKNVPYRQSDVDAFYYKSDGDGGKKKVTLMKGRLAEFIYPKSQGISVYVFDKMAAGADKQGLLEVQLENVEFARKYRVFASDQHAAFYLLTPQMMEYIMKLGQKNILYIRFHNGRVYVMRHGVPGMFEPSYFKKVDVDFEISRTKSDMCELLGIVDILKLS